MITFVDDIPAAPRDLAEARQPDGRWPVCRPDMGCPVAILDRMAEDCLAIFDRGGMIQEADLVRLAWSRPTVRLYADRARETFVRRNAARRRAHILGRAA